MKTLRFAALIAAVLGTGAGYLNAADEPEWRPTEDCGVPKQVFKVKLDEEGKKTATAFAYVPKNQMPEGQRPWLWFAPTLADRFPNQSHNWLFKRLVEAGFVICGVDIDESWGNPEGRKTFSKFYEHMVKEFGLAPKACMLAESRGGLMVFNWAAENPKLVQCIGAIYPVCKITGGPFFARIYNLAGDDKLNEEALAKNFKDHNPLDRLAPLAAEKVPLMILHGGLDRIVPAADHSVELARRYLKLDGPITLIIRRSNDRDQAIEFFESDELLDFFVTQGRPPENKTPQPPAGAAKEPPKEEKPKDEAPK